MIRFRFAPIAFIAAVAATAPLTATGAEITVDAASRTNLSLTLYQSDLALISETRRVAFADGAATLAFDTLAFDHVSRSLDPTSVRIDAGPGARVDAISFAADLLTPESLLRHALGGKVGIIRSHPTTGAETLVEARVLSLAGGVVLEVGDRIETGVPGRLVFFDRPVGLRPRPALLADIGGVPAGDHEIGLAYLSGGMGWQAHYTIELAPEGGYLDLEARAALRNQSGIGFDNATVRLIAGEVHRQTPPRPLMRTMAMADAAMAPEAKGGAPARQALESFHLYVLPRPVSLKDRETRQVMLLGGRAVPVARELISHGSPSVFGAQRGEPAPSHPRATLRFKTGPKSGLGQPLPGGLARIYARDAAGGLQFVGEDRIGNTPVGGDVVLTMGQAFDVTVTRVQTAFQQVAKRVTESAYRIELRNGGGKPVTVHVDENIPGDWKIIEDGGGHAREGARAVWRVTVPANGDAELVYRVRVER